VQWKKLPGVVLMANPGKGLGAYTDSPAPAFFGWRLRNAGQPAGGQYHSFEACHSTPYNAAPQRQSSPSTIAANSGRRLVYRSSAEPNPRANASGSQNTVRTRHRQYRGHLGIMSPWSYGRENPIERAQPILTQACGTCGPIRRRAVGTPIRSQWPFSGGGSGATSCISQPESTCFPQPSPWVYGYKQCYYEYQTPQPSPTLPAGEACYLPGQGLPLETQTTAASTCFLSGETIIPGISNLMVLLVGGLGIFLVARSG
jgi:hypothetical protein